LADEIPGSRQAIRARMNCFNIPHQYGVDHSIYYHTIHDLQQVKVVALNLEKRWEAFRLCSVLLAGTKPGCLFTRMMENNGKRNKGWKVRREESKKRRNVRFAHNQKL